MPNIQFLLINCLLITGLYASTWDGMIFEKARIYIQQITQKILGDKSDWFLKPIFGCVICMSSIWGGSAYIVVYGLTIGIIPHIIALAGLNTIVSGIIYLAYERNANS